MDFIVFSGICYLIISIVFIVSIIKKKDNTNYVSYCFVYHVLTLGLIAGNSTNKAITSKDFGTLIFLYAIIASVFYMACCIILEKKKEKTEK